jgi:hypothetical protein
MMGLQQRTQTLQAELPYNGTSGHSGTEASQIRATEADKSGKTALRQAQVIFLLEQQGTAGLTWKEFSQVTGWHHGTATGLLSVLHKTERIARLKEIRNGCKVYVDLSSIEGREIEPQGNKKCCPHCGGNL